MKPGSRHQLTRISDPPHRVAGVIGIIFFQAGSWPGYRRVASRQSFAIVTLFATQMTAQKIEAFGLFRVLPGSLARLFDEGPNNRHDADRKRCQDYH